MDDSAHRRPKPKVPDPIEPIEDDPFEMDWPWPNNLPRQTDAKAPVEPSRHELAEEPPASEPAEEHEPIEGNGK